MSLLMYVSLIESARKERGKYKVKVVDFTFFKRIIKMELHLRASNPANSVVHLT